MTIQIARRIGAALGVSSATKIQVLDQSLREYVRSVSPGAALPILGSIDWSHITSIPATFPPSAHTHPNGDLPGYTAADVLAKLLTVDGPGSGLDADLLDGQSSATFQPVTTTGTWTPVDNSGAGLVITVLEATYALLGNLVIARARISYPATASGAGAEISGMPFTVAAGLSNLQGFVTWSNYATHMYVMPVAGGTALRFYTGAGGGAQLTNAQIASSSTNFTAMYLK